MSISLVAHDMVEQIRRDLLHQKESIIFEQMNKLMRDGVLLIEETQPVIVQRSDATGVELRQSVRLTYIGEQVISELKDENAKLKAQLADIRKAIGEL